MNKFLFLLAIVVPFLFVYDIQAAEGDLWLDLNVASKHTGASEYTYNGKTEDFNETNLGAGLSYDIDGTFEATGGFFRNSYDKNSMYAGVKAKRDFFVNKVVLTPGLTVGLVTGYDNTEANGRQFQPLAVPNVTAAVGRFRGTVGYIPLRLVSSAAGTDVVTFQLGYKF